MYVLCKVEPNFPHTPHSRPLNRKKNKWIIFVYLFTHLDCYSPVTRQIHYSVLLNRPPPIDSFVSEDTWIEPRTVTTLALASRRALLSASSHLQLGYIQVIQPQSARSLPHATRSCAPLRLFDENVVNDPKSRQLCLFWGPLLSLVVF